MRKTRNSFNRAELEELLNILSSSIGSLTNPRKLKSTFEVLFSNIGLRNARINFRQLEETHTIENVLYHELFTRGYKVDVGVVTIQQRDSAGKMIRKQLKVDFACSKDSKRYYIQYAYSMPTTEKMEQKQRSRVMSVYDFLLNANSLEQ